MKRSLMMCGAACALLMSTAAVAQDNARPSLKVGDKAPQLDAAHWLNFSSKDAEPVTTFDKDHVYVVEFWATWCGPCRASMPHLAKLQEQYRDYDVSIIGVSDESLHTVVGFMADQHPQMKDKTWYDVAAYNIATDPDKSVYTDYMKAAGQNGIPTAFIVGRDNIIEWIGHPLSMDRPLDKIVKDTWDRDEYQRLDGMRNDAMSSMRDGDFDAALRKLDEIMKLDPGNESDRQMKVSILLAADRTEAALTEMDHLLRENPDDRNLKFGMFMTLATRTDHRDRAAKLGRELVETSWDNADELNELAWLIVDAPEMRHRDLDLALKAAERASTLTDHKNAAVLDTYARAYYEMGDIEKAVSWQRKAVEHAEHPQMKQQLQDMLERYEREAK